MNTMVDTTNTTTMKSHQLAREIHTPSGTEQGSTMMITNAVYPAIAGAYRAALGEAESPLSQNDAAFLLSMSNSKSKGTAGLRRKQHDFFFIIVT